MLLNTTWDNQCHWWDQGVSPCTWEYLSFDRGIPLGAPIVRYWWPWACCRDSPTKGSGHRLTTLHAGVPTVASINFGRVIPDSKDNARGYSGRQERYTWLFLAARTWLFRAARTWDPNGIVQGGFKYCKFPPGLCKVTGSKSPLPLRRGGRAIP